MFFHLLSTYEKLKDKSYKSKNIEEKLKIEITN